VLYPVDDVQQWTWSDENAIDLKLKHDIWKAGANTHLFWKSWRLLFNKDIWNEVWLESYVSFINGLSTEKGTRRSNYMLKIWYWSPILVLSSWAQDTGLL
jgi:hypothetical protein